MIEAATGHRPNKLGGYSIDVHRRLVAIAASHLVVSRPDAAISGFALGWDMAWCEAAQILGIPTIAAIPFIEQASQWPAASIEQWQKLLRRCAEVHIVCGSGYAAWKMQKRNEWMVDKCDRLVSLWDQSAGGTANCVKYAQRKNKHIVNLWEQFAAC